jgi:hypothetical protein
MTRISQLFKSYLSGRIWPMVAIMAGIIVSAAPLIHAAWLPAPGDEPPIRVKNGSLVITLDASKWKKKRSGWQPQKGHSGESYDVVVIKGDGSTFTLDKNKIYQRIRIEYDDGAAVIIESEGRGKKTSITCNRSLHRVSPNQIIYGEKNKGYISGVYAGANGPPPSKPDCSFRSARELREIIISPRQ